MDILEQKLQQLVTDRFKFLFEQRHLYQSLSVEADEILNAIRVLLGAKHHSTSRDHLFYGPWRPSDPSNSDLLRGRTEQSLDFKVPDVKLYCSTCGGIEAFNNMTSQIRVEKTRVVPRGIEYDLDTLQVFVFSFLCQSCKSVPEVFLVRREGNKLTLSGRSPIEHVQVPKFIPKPMQKYYSDAIVAHQSGQTLPGNFMLRTLIEQWAYSQAGPSATSADQAIAAYMGTLPRDFKDNFPSLEDLYSQLSLDIHKATGSVELFESSISKITDHFDARRLFTLQGKLGILTKP
jgi:hypothetical protein